MRRRDMLLATGAAALGLSAFPFRWAAGQQNLGLKVLYFTRSAGFEHSVVKREGTELSHSEKIMVEVGKRHGVEVVCTKDGSVFDGDLDQYAAIAFYTSGDLTKEKEGQDKPMTPQGKQNLLDYVAGGKGFVGLHAANDSFHSKGDQIDPYIEMIGGEFVSHGPQQKAVNRIVSPNFPGMEGLGDKIEYLEEWYAAKNFNPDLHVILVQETKGMEGRDYQRPPFPATWARKHGKGRVFYTSLGHREDVWTDEVFQQIVVGGFSWVMGEADADVTPNMKQVTPQADQLPK